MANTKQQKVLSRDFHAFLSNDARPSPRSEAEREALFRDFLAWRKQQDGRSQ
jgi:hypothetical protein